MSKIVIIAKTYLGQEEISPNKSFKDENFLNEIKSVGWYIGAPWCLFFCRLVWKKSNQDITRISASSMVTMEQATKDKNWHVEPKIGAIAIFRMFKNGKPTNQGHGCIVSELTEKGYDTIDGNTSEKNGREGIMVAERFRTLNAESWTKKDGLRLMGFVYPK